MIRITNNNLNDLLNIKNKKSYKEKPLLNKIFLKKAYLVLKKKNRKKNIGIKKNNKIVHLNYYFLINKFFYLTKTFYSKDFHQISKNKIKYLEKFKYGNYNKFNLFVQKLKLLVDNDLLTVFLKSLNFLKINNTIVLNTLKNIYNFDINKNYFFNSAFFNKENIIYNFRLLNNSINISNIEKKESLLYTNYVKKFFYSFNKRKKNIRIFIKKFCLGSNKTFLNNFSNKIKHFIKKYKFKEIFFFHFYYSWRFNGYKKKNFFSKYNRIGKFVEEDRNYILYKNTHDKNLSIKTIIKNYDSDSYFDIVMKNRFFMNKGGLFKDLFLYKDLFLFFWKNNNNNKILNKKNEYCNYIYSNSSFFLKKFLNKNKFFNFFNFLKKRINKNYKKGKVNKNKFIKLKNIEKFFKNNKFGFFFLRNKKLNKFFKIKNKTNIHLKKNFKKLQKKKIYKFFLSNKFFYNNFLNQITKNNIYFLLKNFFFLKNLGVLYKYSYRYKNLAKYFLIAKKTSLPFFYNFVNKNKINFIYNFSKSSRRVFTINTYKNKFNYSLYKKLKKKKLRVYKKKNYDFKKLTFFLLKKRKFYNFFKLRKKKNFIYLHDYKKILFKNFKKQNLFKYTLFNFFNYKVNSHKRNILYNYKKKKNTFKNIFVKHKFFNNSSFFYLNEKWKNKKIINSFKYKKFLFNFIISFIFLKNQYKINNIYSSCINFYNFYNKLNLLKQKIISFNRNLLYNLDFSSDLVGDLNFKLNIISSFEKEVKINFDEFNRFGFYNLGVISKSEESLNKKIDEKNEELEKIDINLTNYYLSTNVSNSDSDFFFKFNKDYNWFPQKKISNKDEDFYSFEESIFLYNNKLMPSLNNKFKLNLNFYEKKIFNLIFQKNLDIENLKIKKSKKIKRFDII